VTSVTWTASDAAGNTSTATQNVVVQDTTPPVLTAPAAMSVNSTTGQLIAVNIGTATATDIFAVTITNDAPATFQVGTTTVTWTAADANGNISTATQLVTVTFVDTIPPVITPPANITQEATAALTPVNLGVATATDNVDATVLPTNNAPASFPVGITTVIWTATDTAGNTATATQTITITDTTPPSLVAPLNVNLTSTDGNPVFDVIGTATATDLVDGAVTVTNNAPASFPVGVTTVTYTATDAAGNSATASQIVTVTYTPPLPPASPAAATIPDGSFGALYRSLVPADATIAAYNPDRLSIITGMVNDLNGLPISGVKVMVHSHPEYGSSLTDNTGRYSLPVDGGALFTVDITHPNYLMVQRQVKTEWNQIYTSETVALIVQDAKATTVVFDGNPATKIVHSSTPVTDVDGTRATHLVFSGNTTASVTHADGTVTALNGPMTVRATEFVRPDTMPGDLPPTSAFTYCADIRVDGTLPTDSVQFSQPVVMYVDNFLGFPIGEAVPVGYFDRVKAVWVPSDNGVVVQLLDTNADGIVDALDSTGDGLPNDLNANGSFADEVAGIAGNPVYAVGASYWRAGITHFTPWDHNWPYDLPNGATPPPAIPPFVEGETDCPDEGHLCTGSEVSRESRIFSEDISIPGTDLKLHYKSSRAAGYKQVITIPVTGATIPASVMAVTVSVKLAGRVFSYNVSKLPNQEVTLVWDGVDAYGKRVSGKITAHVTVAYAYQLVYGRSPATSNLRAFGQSGQPGTYIASRVDLTARMAQKFNVLVDVDMPGTVDAGWSISEQHQLKVGNLYRGDGREVAGASPFIITTVAGGRGNGFSGDGGLATQAALAYPEGIAVAADGSLYIADTNNSRIRKVSPDGMITTVAGNSSRGFSGDGGSATQATLNSPWDVAVAADGSLYIADTGNDGIRKVSPDGMITTVAGNSSWGFSGDGGSATQAALNSPWDVAVAADGSLYITDTYNHRIRKVSPDGMITTVAGSGTMGFSGDGGLATQAALAYPEGIAVAADGSLYIVDTGNHRIRKVSPDGIITTVAGSHGGYFSGDGGLATQAALNSPSDIAVAADGSLYISDFRNHRIRKVSPDGIITTVAGNGVWGFSGDGGLVTQAALAYPGGIVVAADGSFYIVDTHNHRIRKLSNVAIHISVLANEQLYSSRNDGEAYVFNASGQHLRTVDLDSGTILKSFAYDAVGNLISITDRFGAVTQILNSGGVPYAIIAPDGQTTNLNITNGQLDSVVYPDGSGYSFNYTIDGLLTGKTDPNGGQFVYTYDANGRVIQTQDAVNGISQFATSSAKGILYATTTDQEGHVSTSTRKNEFSGASLYTRTSKNGLTSSRSTSSDALTETSTSPDGTISTTKFGIDPHYKSKRTDSTQVRLPSGLASNQSSTIAYVDNNADGKPDVITKTFTNNALVSSIVDDVVNGTRTITTPAGRTATVNYNVTNLLTASSTTPGLAGSTYAYDFRGRLTDTTVGSLNPRTTTLAYDASGNVASVSDALNRVTSFGYDVMGRVTNQTLPDGRSIAYSYDNLGNLLSITPPGRNAHVFNYTAVREKGTLPFNDKKE